MVLRRNLIVAQQLTPFLKGTTYVAVPTLNIPNPKMPTLNIPNPKMPTLNIPNPNMPTPSTCLPPQHTDSRHANSVKVLTHQIVESHKMSTILWAVLFRNAHQIRTLGLLSNYWSAHWQFSLIRDLGGRHIGIRHVVEGRFCDVVPFWIVLRLHSHCCFISSRVARFFLVQHTKTGKYTKQQLSLPKCHKIYVPIGNKIVQMSIKYVNIVHCETV
jgi:hypothetical protein